MKSSVVVFPFDLFGSSGASAGAALISDELRNILADNKRETVPTRAAAYTNKLRLREVQFETIGDYQNWRTQGLEAVRQAWRNDNFLVWVAGNHLGVLPVYDELGRRADVLVLQLDAHLDIHHFADCTSELSHGNFLRHVEKPTPPIVNVGHRELLLPTDEIERFYQETISAEKWILNSQGACDRIRSVSESAKYVFLDIDCDVFDPAFFPAVSNPSPMGLTPQDVLRCLDAAWSDRVIGLAISEFDPGRDRDDRSLAVLMWLLEYLLLRKFEGGRKSNSSD